jgi:hypothetical protein
VPDEYDDDVLEQLDAGDTLDVGGPKDWLDEGWSPVERPWAMNAWGTTAREEAAGEGLDRKLARELADVEPADGDGLGDTSDTDGELRDDEVGRSRAGRLVAEDEGGAFDRDKGLFARDAGIDGAGASAEEAAVHLVEE